MSAPASIVYRHNIPFDWEQEQPVTNSTENTISMTEEQSRNQGNGNEVDEPVSEPTRDDLWMDMQLLADKIENGHLSREDAAEQLRLLTRKIPGESNE